MTRFQPLQVAHMRQKLQNDLKIRNDQNLFIGEVYELVSFYELLTTTTFKNNYELIDLGIG